MTGPHELWVPDGEENTRLLESYEHYEKNPPLLIRPHPDAPYFSDIDTAQETMKQVISEITSGNMITYSEEVRQYLRQAAMVNLWFFLKFVAGFNGPYDKLNKQLHMDMCNVRMSDYGMAPGARTFAFIPRSCYKSTIFSHGANSWEIVRWPDIRIRIVNAIIDRAVDFKRVTQRTFDSNVLFAWLFPEYVPSHNADRWNEKEMVVPNRTRYYKEPTVKTGGATGSAEGDHHDLLDLDDLIGLDDLNSERGANASMETKKNWFQTNTKALLDSWRTSRMVGVATRYAVDDVYSIPVQSMKRLIGYQHPEMKTNPKGQWTVYYRKAEENGEIIFPEMLTKEGLEELRTNPDTYWTYITQYENDPQASGMSEFYQFEPGIVDVYYDPKEQDYVIDFPGHPKADIDPFRKRLSDLDVVMSVDPAATERGMTSKTSRSSVGIWAQDSQMNVYRIWEKVGFLDIHELLDAMFEGHKRFPGHVRGTFFESNAFQRVIKPLIEKEQTLRNQYINPQPVPASGDKDARIRTAFGSRLHQNRVFLNAPYSANFIDEMRVFPMSQHRKDVLDESEKAMSALVVPFSEEELARREWAEEEMAVAGEENLFGY